MKKISLLSLFGITLFLLASCGGNSEEANSIDTTIYRKKGLKISKATQATLLSNVAEAIQQKGVPQAIDYCNIQAFQITDSLSRLNNCTIQRVSDRNRNPNNGLKTEMDTSIWNHYKTLEFDQYEDSVIVKDGMIAYYKPNPIMMPNCLRCHVINNQIALETKTRIASLYPQDKAVGYSMNDLRGLWKITWDELQEGD